jgi:hypothetical protein
LRTRLIAACALAALTAASAAAGNYLFLSKRYLALTEKVAEEAGVAAEGAFPPDAKLKDQFAATRTALKEMARDANRARILKEMGTGAVMQTEDARFTETLNAFKDGLNYVSQKKEKPLEKLLPTYKEWFRVELDAVERGLDQRLAAYEVRYGPESERLNFLEWLAGEIAFPGGEGAPSPWEPIARLTPIQATTAGSGLVSTVQVGLNRYFIDGKPPAALKWIGVRNHVGLAASLQYLDQPRPARFEGRPAFGVVLHMDRRELGLAWDPSTHNVRATVGYAFQVLPLVM